MMVLLKRCVSLLFLFAVMSATLIAQVNTEVMRKRDTTQGFQTSLSLKTTLLQGNSDFFRIEAGARSDYRSGPFYTFLTGSLARGEEDKKLFLNKGFLHLRGIYTLSDLFKAEVFAQKEFNEFLRLRDRNLLGGGIRTSLIDYDDSAGVRFVDVHLGNGAMYEHEVEDDELRRSKNLVRSTNYLSFLWGIDSRLTASLVTYYQVDITRLADFRILHDTGISFDVIKGLAIQIIFHYRYDNEPYEGVKKYDLELTNGLSLTF